jgi:hypothetical protein
MILMGRGSRRWWQVALIIMVIVVAGAVLWGVWRSSERNDLSTFGGFAVAFVALVSSCIVYLAKVRQRGDPGRGRTLDQIADLLAKAVKKQWDDAARDRDLLQPIPVTWRGSTGQLTGPVSAAVRSDEFPPLPGLSRIGPEQLRSGTLQELHGVYGGLGSGRLVILGPPGSGKTGAAVLLIRAAVDYRKGVQKKKQKLVPVPVLFTLQGWNPDDTSIGDWIAERLRQTYPLFADRGGRAEAAALVEGGRVAVMLDGLDEIPAELRPVALQALSRQADFRLVVLGRSDETAAAAREKFLTRAVAVELQDVGPEAAADYLTSVQRDPPPDGWRELTSRLREAPNGSIARVLSNPLTLTLIRDTYREGDDIRGLLDLGDQGEHGASREAIEDYLLDRVLHAAYTRQPGEKPLRYGFPTAQRALTYIAVRMKQDGTRDLAWWRTRRWANAGVRVLAVVFLAIVAVSLGVALANTSQPGISLDLGIGGGAGIGFGLLAGILARRRDRYPRRISPFRLRQVFRLHVLAVGLVAVLTLGIGVAFKNSVARGLAAAFGIPAFLAVGLMAGFSGPAADDQSPFGPRTSWRNDRSFGVVAGLAAGFGFGLAAGLGYGLPSGPGYGPASGLAAGLAWGLSAGLGFGLAATITLSASLAFGQVAMRRRTPVRLMRFLEDARERNVLRTVGPVYQFRHARLQDRLALQGGAGSRTRGRNAEPAAMLAPANDRADGAR